MRSRCHHRRYIVAQVLYMMNIVNGQWTFGLLRRKHSLLIIYNYTILVPIYFFIIHHVRINNNIKMPSASILINFYLSCIYLQRSIVYKHYDIINYRQYYLYIYILFRYYTKWFFKFNFLTRSIVFLKQNAQLQVPT